MDTPTETFIYCNNRKCNHEECLRKIKNAPWNVRLRVERYEPDKAGSCKQEVVE